MIEMAILESIVSQPMVLDMAMFYVNVFFTIIALQITHAAYVLYNEEPRIHHNGSCNWWQTFMDESFETWGEDHE